VSTVLPPPAPLPDPPGSAPALGTVVDQLTSAGFSAGLTVHLLQPATVVHGWQGADAVVAAAEVTAAGAVAADLHAAVTAAAGRLGDHAELWTSVLSRLASLREDQRHQYATAAARLAVLVDGPDAGTAPPEAVALVRAVARDDAARGAQHSALLADLADDAASAAALLGSLSAPFGGEARPGDVERVTLRLAGVLPGWGDGALTALGVQAAADLERPTTAAELDAAARRWTAYAASPAFADALLGRLGEDGVTWLLTVLGGRSVETEREALAGLLAAAAGAAEEGSRAAEVLGGVRLDPTDPDGTPDTVAVGMGMVLTALAAAGRAGSGTGLAVGWGRQVLAREAAQGATAVERTTATLPDPLGAALAVLVAAGDPGAAAATLADPDSWTGLLARSWPGGVSDLVEVIDLAARAPEAPQVAAAALQALGQGLRPGTTEEVLVDDALATAVGSAVTDLVAGRMDVVLPVLGAAAGVGAGEVDDATDLTLRGLGHLLADDARVRTLGDAVRGALAAGLAGPADGGRVAGGYVAVEEYGQRISYVLEHARAQSWEVDQQLLWDTAVTMPVKLLTWRQPYGDVVEGVTGELQRQLGFDGTVDIGPDTGDTYAAWHARRWAGAVLGSAGGDPAAVSAAAEAGFARATEVLGRPLPPQPGLLDQLEDLQGDLPDRREGGREQQDRPRVTGRR
jgi:hypothetical protein